MPSPLELALQENTATLRDLIRTVDRPRGFGGSGVGGGGFGGGRAQDPFNQLNQFVRTMRFGGGGRLGGMMPLVGRTLDVFGLGKMAGPIGIAVGTLGLFAEGVRKATERLNELGEAGIISGGTPGQIGRLEAMGISPGQIAGRAAALRERISHDQFAMSLAGRAGVNPYPRPFGDPNEAKGFLNILEYVRNIKSESEQLRAARIFGIEDLLPKLRVSEEVWQRQKRVALAQEKMTSRETSQAARDLASNTELLGQSLNNLWTQTFQPLIKSFSDSAAWLTDKITALINARSKADAEEEKFKKQSYEEQQRQFKQAQQQGKWTGAGWLFSPVKPDTADPAKAQADAADAQRKAAEEMRRLTENMQGLFGGGARARGALGAGWQGEFFRRAAMGQALRMGAFSL